jgi:HD superfamily phosphohydrolase
MEIRDVIHGSVHIERWELPILDSRFFQRLRQIKQLGFAEYSFPSAVHNRYIHSLGAMHTATQAFDTIFGGPAGRSGQFTPDRVPLFRTHPKVHARLRACVRLASLLHDVGHGPLSHTTEFAMPDVRQLEMPPRLFPHLHKGKSRQATHEDYTLKILLDSSLTPLLEKAGREWGFRPEHIASLIEPQIPISDAFFLDTIGGERLDFQPLLQQLISSELDADRMDYLRRDSVNAGVSYGQFDFDWLVGNLTSHVKDGKCFLALQHRALYSFEDFLISRFHMFLMVYFHYKSVVYDSMLGEYMRTPDCDYSLPADIEKYCESNDAQLYAHLAKSQNPWARRITEKRPYRMLVELHSGIPATKTAAQEQARLISRIEKDLTGQKIHYLSATSTSELSKYFRRPGNPIFVRYDNHYSQTSFIPLERCTDLFERYSEKRSIRRLYVEPERYSECRWQGRGAPLRYEDDSTPGIGAEDGALSDEPTLF